MLGKGNVFTGVCDSVHGGGVSASVHVGIPPPPGSRLRHTVNERPVRILLECILVPQRCVLKLFVGHIYKSL